MKRIGILLALLVLWTGQADAATYYVSAANAVTTATGTAGNPYPTFTAAVTRAVAGDVIRIGQGTYTEQGYTIASGVKVYGGYPGFGEANAFVDASRAPVTTVTNFTYTSSSDVEGNVLIDGVRYSEISCCSYALNTTGASVTIVNSSFIGYYGVSVNGSEARNLKIQNNYFEGDSTSLYVGGVLGAIISGNEFEVDGYGIVLEDSTATIENNTFDIWDDARGISIQNESVVTVKLNFFDAGNSSRGIQISDSQVTADDNEFVVWDYSRGISMSYGNLLARRNEFQVGYESRGISNWNGGNLYIHNNTFTGEPGEWSTGVYLSWQVDYAHVSQNTFESLGSIIYGQPRNDDLLILENNLAIGNGQIGYGYVEMDRLSRDGFYVRNNCFDEGFGGVFSLETEDGMNKPMASIKTAEAFSERIVGNIAYSSQTAAACALKGAAGAAPVLKPVVFARGHNYDEYNTNNLVSGDVGGNLEDEFTFEAWDVFAFGYDWSGYVYEWKQISGPATVKIWPNTAAESVTATPTKAGKYVFQLRVKDPASGTLFSDPVQFAVYVDQKVTLTSLTGVLKGSYTNIEDAVEDAVSGDTITLPPGVFYTSEVEVYGKSNLTIKGAGSGPGGTVLASYWGDAFEVDYSSNLTIRDLAWADASSDGYRFLDLWSSAGIVVDNVHTDARTWGRDYDATGIESTYTDLTVRNVDFRNLSNAIVAENGGRLKVENSKFVAIEYHALGINSLNNDESNVEIIGNEFLQGGMGDEVIDLEYSYSYERSYLIAKNKIADFYNDAINVYDSDDRIIHIYDNVIYNDLAWENADGGGMDLTYTSAHVKGNIVWGLEDSGVQIRDSYDSYQFPDAMVENNVIANNGSSDYDYGIKNRVDYCGGCYKTSARNNILYNNSGGPYYQVNVITDNGNPTDQFVDPGFTDANAGDFSPAPGSPLETLAIGGIQVATGIGAPTGLAGEAQVNAALITFNEVAGATSYTIYWGAKAGDFSQSRNVGAERYATIANLSAKPYYFAVAASDDKGEGAKSSSIIVVPTAPEATVEEPAPEVSPEIFGVNPSEIKLGEVVTITITGSGFVKGAKVKLGNIELSDASVVDENTIEVMTVAALTPGSYAAIVINPDLNRGAMPQALSVVGSASDVSATNSSGGCASTGADAGFAFLLIPLAYLIYRRKLS